MPDGTALAELAEDAEQLAPPMVAGIWDAQVIRALRNEYPDWATVAVPVTAVQAKVDELFPQASGQKCGAPKGYRIQKLISPALFPKPESGSRKPKPSARKVEPEARKLPPEGDGRKLEALPELPAELPEAAAPEAAEIPAEARPELPVEPARTSGPRGVFISWTAFLFGGLMSIAANVAHATYPTPIQLDAWVKAGNSAASWTPELGSMITAAFWPIGLVLAIECLTRVEWHPGNWFSLARYVGLSVVALVAAVMSYRHMADLLGIWGEDQFGRHLGPFAIDGLMLIAATALLSISKTRRRNANPKEI